MDLDKGPPTMFFKKGGNEPLSDKDVCRLAFRFWLSEQI